MGTASLLRRSNKNIALVCACRGRGHASSSLCLPWSRPLPRVSCIAKANLALVVGSLTLVWRGCRGVQERGLIARRASSSSPLHVELVVAFCTANLSWVRPSVDYLEASCGAAVALRIYSKCDREPADHGAPRVVPLPNLGREGHTYAHHLSQLHAVDPGAPAITILLKDSAASDGVSPSRLCHMAHAVRKTGFACARGPFAYHESRTLARFSWDFAPPRAPGAPFYQARFSAAHNNTSSVLADVPFLNPSLRTFREWIQSVPTLERSAPLTGHLVPVCYGGMLAASRHRLLRVPAETWSALRAALARGDNIVENHFAERTWAMLLMDPLSKGAADAVQCASGVPAALGSSYGGKLTTCLHSVDAGVGLGMGNVELASWEHRAVTWSACRCDAPNRPRADCNLSAWVRAGTDLAGHRAC